MRRKLLVPLVLLAALAGSLGVQGPVAVAQEEPAETPRPNILLIVSDDQSNALFNRQLMPTVFSKIVDRGVNFDKAYVNTSQCCPSRAQILSGLYGHSSGVDGNHVALLNPTIAELMKDEGYRTAIAGKYMNSAPCTSRPEFDFWACIKTTQKHTSLRNPELHVNGRVRQYKGYQTEVLANMLTNFIRRTPENKPFFAVYTPTSPHMPADDNRYQMMKVALERSPSFDEDTETSGKPAFMRRGPYSEAEISRIDQVYRKMARSVRGLDDSIGNLLDGLGDRASNTIVIYLSDNGYLYGEHRATKKVLAYEESVRVPFVVRAKGLTGALEGVTSSALVQNVDIAPTVAALVGRDWAADGYSLLPLLSDPEASVRDAALIEFCEGFRYPCEGDGHWGSRRIPSFSGYVDGRYKYVEYWTGDTELYDLSVDPYEMTNLASLPGSEALVQLLAAQLAGLRDSAEYDTAIVRGPKEIITENSAVFRYTSEDRGASFRCRFTHNGVARAWFNCPQFGYTAGGLEDGTYTFEVAGRVGAWTDDTPASRTFTVQSRPES